MKTEDLELECLDPYHVLGRQIRQVLDEEEEALKRVQETHYTIPKVKNG